MIVGERSSFAALDQTLPHPRHLPGRRDIYCPSDAFNQSCPIVDGEEEGFFGLGVPPRAPRLLPGSEFVPPESEVFGLGQGRIPEEAELGQARVSEEAELRGMGQLPGGIPSAALWLVLAGGAIVGTSFLAGNDLRRILQALGAVVGGAGVTTTIAALSA